MSVLSVISLKGGVGKTTISLNLAKEFSKIENLKVALIDADNQHSSFDFLTNYKKEKFCDFFKLEDEKQLKEIKKNYEVVIVDNAPRLNNNSNIILRNTDYCLLVSRLCVFDLLNIKDLSEIINTFKVETSIVLNQVEHFQTSKTINEFKQSLSQICDFNVLNQKLSRSNDYQKANNNFLTLSDIKSSKVAEIQLLIKEIMKS